MSDEKKRCFVFSSSPMLITKEGLHPVERACIDRLPQ
jgi:hypothetical protein